MGLFEAPWKKNQLSESQICRFLKLSMSFGYRFESTRRGEESKETHGEKNTKETVHTPQCLLISEGLLSMFFFILVEKNLNYKVNLCIFEYVWQGDFQVSQRNSRRSSRMKTCQNEEDDLIRPCHGSNPVLQVEHHLSTPTTSHSLEHRRGWSAFPRKKEKTATEQNTKPHSFFEHLS